MTALSVAFLAFSLAAPTDMTPVPEAKLREYVNKLGDKSFRVREEAAKNLLDCGAAAVSILAEGTKNRDAEISERCRLLLPQAAAKERNEKLNQLLADPKAEPPKGLAGLERFLKVTGDDKASRELYAEMMGIHHAALEASAKDPKAGTEFLRVFCDEAYNRWRGGIGAGRVSYDSIFAQRHEVTIFFFLASDPQINTANATSRASIMFNSPKLTTHLSGPDSTSGMRKLFMEWIANERQPYMQQRGFQIAGQIGMKEALPLALKIIDQKGLAATNRAQALLSLTKLGNKDNLKDIEGLLNDKSVITTVNFGNGMTTVQMRDVALATSIVLSGQNMSDFGFDNRFGGVGNNLSSYIYCGFADDKPRDAAHAKWKEWLEKNPKK